MNPTSEPTPEEAIRQLREIDPTRTYSVRSETWHHVHRENVSATQWDISIQPGLDGHDCNLITGSSLTGALENAKAGLLSAGKAAPRSVFGTPE